MVMWRATLANATGIRVYPTLIQTNMAEVSSPVIGSFAGSVLMYKESPNGSAPIKGFTLMCRQ